MSRLILFNKPYGVVCQFRPVAGQMTLADFIDVRGVYPAGRLDRHSEGLLLLTDDGRLQARITDPRFKLEKSYFVQLDGTITPAATEALRGGIDLNDGRTRPARVEMIAAPNLPHREPPVRVRKSVPTSWISIALREGRNRQVRRMTAAVGFPTLRLYRYRIGTWQVEGLGPGEYRQVSA